MRRTSVLTLVDIEKIQKAFKGRVADSTDEFALAVTDSHGELLYFIKTDNCCVSAGTIAQCKAFTASRDRQKSSSLAVASAESGFAVSSLGDIRYTGLGGGVPIIVDNECIGAVAVSGMSQEQDEKLAEAIVHTII